MKKFITLLLTGTMLLSMPVLANDDDNYTGAINQVKSLFNVPEYENFDVTNDGGSMVLNWENKSNGDYATAYLKNGVVTFFINSDEKTSEKGLSEAQLTKKSNEFLNKILGNDYENWKLKSTQTYSESSTEFTYVRYIGNYAVDEDLIDLSICNSDGEVVRYARSLDKAPNVTIPKKLISPVDAKDIYLKNSNFGPWYTKYSDKPIFTYITTGLDNDTDIDFLYRTEFPCVDAETGELFYGTGYIDSLNNLYSDADLNSSAMAKAEYSEDFQQNTDEFITTENAVNIINNKLGLNLKAKDFDFVYSIAEKNSKTAYFSKKDDISSFSINDKGEVTSYGFYSDDNNDNIFIDINEKADEIIKKNGFNIPDFYKFNYSKNEIRYYKKINRIPSTEEYIDISFNSKGEIKSFNNSSETMTYNNVTPTISTDEAFDIANSKCSFIPTYVKDYNNPDNFRLAYCFNIKPMIDCEGNLLTGNGQKYYSKNQIYADITNKEDRANVLFLYQAGYTFEDLTKFEPDKTLTLKDLTKYLNGRYALESINKCLNTKYTEKDADTPLTVKQVIILLESYTYTNNLPMLSSAFKNQDNDVYTNIALNIGAIKNADGLDNNATRMDLANYVYKIIYGQNE